MNKLLSTSFSAMVLSFLIPFILINPPEPPKKMMDAKYYDDVVSLISTFRHYKKVDTNKDGKFDTLIYELNNDDNHEVIISDMNFDGKIDIIYVDFDSDGKVEAVITDEDKDKNFEHYLLDTDFNGEFDTIGIDENKDGIPDSFKKL